MHRIRETIGPFILALTLVSVPFSSSAEELKNRSDASRIKTPAGDYLVIDLSKGRDAASFPVSRLSSAPVDGWGDEYRTFKLVLRHIPAGTFMMGSLAEEPCRVDNEDLHEVTLSKSFHIGVFEVTQRQWELVMGELPVLIRNTKTLMAPVSNVSYEIIRGSNKGAKWPTSDEVDDETFLGVLRAKTGLRFDLPTEAQWEYACRAGTSSSLNNGTDVAGRGAAENVATVAVTCHRPAEDGFWRFDATPVKVGSLAPNDWGLYDMHGNALEWCLDWYSSHLGSEPAKDPKGAVADPSGHAPYRCWSTHVLRGGCSHDTSESVRSAARVSDAPNARDADGIAVFGFRVACP